MLRETNILLVGHYDSVVLSVSWSAFPEMFVQLERTENTTV